MYKPIHTIEQLQNCLKGATVVAFDFETAPTEQYRTETKSSLDPNKSQIIGISFSIAEGDAVYLPLAHRVGENASDPEIIWEWLSSFFADPTVTKIAHNLAFESAFLYARGIVVQEPCYDTIAASQLMYKNEKEFRTLSDSGLKTLVPEFYKEKLPSFADTVGNAHFDELAPADPKTINYACADADYALRLYHTFNNYFDRFLPNHRFIVEKVESPTAVYVGIMRYNGLPVDRQLMVEKRTEVFQRNVVHFHELSVNTGNFFVAVTARIYDEKYSTVVGIVLFQKREGVREFFQRGVDVRSAERSAFAVGKHSQTNFRVIGRVKYVYKFAPRYSECKGRKKFLPGKLADHLAETENVFFCGESYYFYDEGVYTPRNEKTAQRKVRSMMDTTYALASEIKDAEWQWMIEVDKTVSEINVNPYLLNFSNGLYNVLTETMQPHDPKILSTIRLGGAYIPDKKCPVFMQYLNDILPQSEHPLIQEIMGYFMIALTKAQKSFVLIGKPDSGKSTFLYVVQDILLGHENVSNLSWQNLDEKFATVQLFGKLANIFGDLPSQPLKDTGTFKAITGEDYISAQHKFKEYFSFKAFVRLLFSCNQLPKNYTDRTDGFYRRLLLIRFDNAIPENKKDESLKEKLRAETEGIIAYAMAGLRRLLANNYRFTETARTRSELYSRYVEYCSDHHHKPVSDRKFNNEIDGIEAVKRGQENTGTSNKRTWIGIKLL